MTKIIKRVISGLDNVKTFFTQLSTECSLIDTTNENDIVCIGGQVHLRHKNQGYGSETEMYDNDGTLLGSMINAGGNGGHYQERYTVVYSDSMCLVVSDAQIPYSYNYGYIVVLYEKIGTQEFYGVAYQRQNSGIIFQSIENYVVKDVSTGITYNHMKQINYDTNPNNIAYTNSVLTSANIAVKEDTNFVSCSTVASNQVVTFGGHNYYSIGTNTLIMVDN